MGLLWKIALRNVFRHGRRTAITCITMAVGIGVFIVYDALYAGLDRVAIDAMAHYSASYVKVRTPEYVANERGLPLDAGIPDAAAVMEKVAKAAPALTAVAPRTLFLAQASNYRDAEPVVCAAVDPVLDPKVFDLAKAVRQGSWFDPGATGARETVISATLAEDLGLGVGDSLLLSARTVYDNDNADEFTIVGITDSGLTLQANLYLTYADARGLLGDGLQVTEIDTASTRAANLGAELAASGRVAAALAPALPGLAVQPIGDFARDYLALKKAKSGGAYIMVFVILLIAGVGIVNTILMSVYSRVREIGVLRAYGMTAKDIKKLFVREGLATGLLGGISGLALGAVLVAWLDSLRISLASVAGKMDMGGLPVNAILRLEWKPETFLTGLVFGLLAAWLAARGPSKRAARMEPTDALKFV